MTVEVQHPQILDVMQVLDDVLVGRGVMLLDRLGVDFVGDELDDSRAVNGKLGTRIRFLPPNEVKCRRL
jgi:hypothetical protein